MFIRSQCDDANISIYIGDIAVISSIGLIGLNALSGLIGRLEDALYCSGSMLLTGPSLSGFIEKFYALITGTRTLHSYERYEHMQNKYTSNRSWGK